MATAGTLRSNVENSWAAAALTTYVEYNLAFRARKVFALRFDDWE
jgi:hypothetical protein